MVFVKEQPDLSWIMIEDEYGRDSALQLDQNPEKLLLFPLTMISKRITQGKSLSVAQFYQQICQEIQKRRES